MLTDGYSTEPLTGLGERLMRQKVPMDYRLLSPPHAVDYRISRLDLPTRVQSGEPFLVQVGIAGEPDAEVSLELLRDGVSLGKAPATIKGGTASARFSERLTGSGAHRYTAQVTGANDARPGNDRAEKWIEVAGGPRVLLRDRLRERPADPGALRPGFRGGDGHRAGEAAAGPADGSEGGRS